MAGAGTAASPVRILIAYHPQTGNTAEVGCRRTGRQRFDHAVVTIGGIELAENIKEGQFKTGKLGGNRATMSEPWNAALAA